MARKVEVIIIAAIFTVVVGCFSVPIIIYATGSQHAADRGSIMDQLDISDCTWQVWVIKTLWLSSL